LTTYTFYTYIGSKKLNKFLKYTLTLLLFLLIGACEGRKISWHEEVKLSNGKIIVADQQRICTKANTGGLSSDCMAREAWLTFNLPGFSSAPIKWHEHLIPMVLNISGGKLYLIAYPPSFKEFVDYGAGQHAYFGFVWDGMAWKRISFDDIPASIYDSNMVLNSPPLSRMSYIDLNVKNDIEHRAGQSLLRVDPKDIMNF
jgi:hypothetical protein